jgi:hypothetical protein
MPLRKATGTPIPPTPPAAPLTAPQDLSAPAPFPPSVTLNVPFIAQTQTQWCWAACCAMIARYLDLPEPKQCELANFLHNQTKCCTAPSSAKCNQPCLYVKVMDVAGKAGMKGTGPDFPLFQHTLVQELAAGRPVEIGLNWNAGGGHLIVVYGYTPQGLFLVRDPWNGSGVATYLFLRTAYNMGAWGCSFGRFAKK